MANIAVYLGSAGLTIVLFVGAMLLAIEDNDAWGKFFAIGVYLGTWNTVHAAVRRVASLLVDSSSDSDVAVVAILAYGAGFVISAGITWLVASQLNKFVGVPV